MSAKGHGRVSSYLWNSCDSTVITKVFSCAKPAGEQSRGRRHGSTFCSFFSAAAPRRCRTRRRRPRKALFHPRDIMHIKLRCKAPFYKCYWSRESNKVADSCQQTADAGGGSLAGRRSQHRSGLTSDTTAWTFTKQIKKIQHENIKKRPDFFSLFKT